MVRLFFVTSIEVYSASAFLFIFSYRAEVTQNISTAENPGRWQQLFAYRSQLKYGLLRIFLKIKKKSCY